MGDNSLYPTVSNRYLLLRCTLLSNHHLSLYPAPPPTGTSVLARTLTALCLRPRDLCSRRWVPSPCPSISRANVRTAGPRPPSELLQESRAREGKIVAESKVAKVGGVTAVVGPLPARLCRDAMGLPLS